MEAVQPGTVGLRGAFVAAWEDDLRAVRQDSFDMSRGREALFFIQRFYGLISALRPPIQRAWGAGGHVHVVDSPEIGGPGRRVSQSRIRLRNHCDAVVAEMSSYADGSPRANPSAGLDRTVRAADVDPLVLVTEVSVGKRRLEGHDRPEEVFVVRHPDVVLETAVEEDAVEGLAAG